MAPIKIRSKTFALAVCAAFLIGIAIASIDRVREWSATKPEESARQSVEDEEAGYAEGTVYESVRSYEAGTTEAESHAMQNPYREEDAVIRGSGGLALAADRASGTFNGYRVISPGTDTRLQAGDVIVMVNGVPVEDSAAGGELLLAAMADPDSDIELLDTEDMP